MTMCATILQVECDHLLVCDHHTNQEVIVRTCTRCPFCPGNRVCIKYSGAMTASLPPQITACHVSCLPKCRCQQGCR